MRKLIIILFIIVLVLVSYIYLKEINSEYAFSDANKKKFNFMGISVMDTNNNVPGNNILKIIDGELKGKIRIINGSENPNRFKVIFFVDYSQVKCRLNGKQNFVHTLYIGPNKEVILPFSIEFDDDEFGSDLLVTVIRECEFSGPPQSYILSKRLLVDNPNNKKISNNEYIVRNISGSDKKREMTGMFIMDQDDNILFEYKTADNHWLQANLYISNGKPLKEIQLIGLLDYMQIPVYDHKFMKYDILKVSDNDTEVVLPISINVPDEKEHILILLGIYNPFTKSGNDTLNSLNIDWSADATHALKINTMQPKKSNIKHQTASGVIGVLSGHEWIRLDDTEKIEYIKSVVNLNEDDMKKIIRKINEYYLKGNKDELVTNVINTIMTK